MAERVVASADPIALAVATDATQYDPELARKAAAYLDEQRLLVKLQVKHFDEERRLAVAAAKRKRYAEWIRNGLATFVAGLAGIVVIAAGVMVSTGSIRCNPERTSLGPRIPIATILRADVVIMAARRAWSIGW
jgi:hypothetical protein